MMLERHPPAHRTASTRSVKFDLPMSDDDQIGWAYVFTST